MFELLPREMADEAKAIAATRLDLWVAMNAHVLDCMGQLTHLNLNMSQKFLADLLETMSPTSGPKADEAPDCDKYFFIPQDASCFALYGKEAGNLFATMQQEFTKFAKRSFDVTVRDVPLISPYAASADNAGNPFVHMRHAGEADAAAASTPPKSPRAGKTVRSRAR